jgi:hypothetical protein
MKKVSCKVTWNHEYGPQKKVAKILSLQGELARDAEAINQ